MKQTVCYIVTEVTAVGTPFAACASLSLDRGNLHPVPYLHQCFGDIALPGRESLLHLAQAVPYQLPDFDVAVAHDVGVVDHIYVFSQLVGTDGSIRYQEGLLLLTVWQGDADVESAFQYTFGIVEAGTNIQRSGVQIHVGR